MDVVVHRYNQIAFRKLNRRPIKSRRDLRALLVCALREGKEQHVTCKYDANLETWGRTGIRETMQCEPYSY